MVVPCGQGNGPACCIKLGKYMTRFPYDVEPYFEGKLQHILPFPFTLQVADIGLF